MPRGSSRNDKELVKIYNDRINNIGCCELCGSKKGLELHHIIPVVCGGESTEDNTILICEKCHYMLTPKNTLTKIGIRKIKYNNLLIDIQNFKSDFYQKIYNITEEEISAVEIVDCFDDVYNRLLRENKIANC